MVESSSSLPPPAQTSVRGGGGGDDTHRTNTNASIRTQEPAQHAGSEVGPAAAAATAVAKKAHAHPQGIVVKTFLEMYYNVLTKKSEHLFGFYKPHGSFQHSMASNAGAASKLVLANGVNEIQQKCAQLPYSHATVHMVSVSHQTLANESMLILVTGVMDGLPFVQSFVLAKEAEGVYYLENDILHISAKEPPTNLREGPEYIGHEQVAAVGVAAALVAAASSASSEPAKAEAMNGVSGAKAGPKAEKARETTGSAQAPGPVVDAANAAPSAAPVVGAKNASKDHPKPEKKKDASPVTEAAAVAVTPASEPSASATSAPAEKTSWASLFRKDAPAHPTAAPVVSSAPAPAPVSGDSKDVSGAASDESASLDGGENAEGGANNVVWVGQLPSDAGLTSAKVNTALQDFFGKYGAITRMNVYLNKGFAFVDMDSAESAQNALNAWPKDRHVLETSLQVKNLVVKTKKAGAAASGKKDGGGGASGGSGSGSGRRQRDRIKVEESVKRVNGEDVPVKSFRTAGGYGKSSNKKAQAS